MAISAESMLRWCQALLDPREPERSSELETYLSAIPRLDSLDRLPRGTHVLVRGDLDAKPGTRIGDGDVRLRSMLTTLKFGIERGWKQIVFGHVGRKPEGSLGKVRTRLEELLQTKIPLIEDWFDESTSTIPDHVSTSVADAEPGTVLLLENTRRYDIERALWKAKTDDLPQLVERLARFAEEMSSKLARVYGHEALSAGSLDSSSVIVTAGMEQVALGAYEASELEGPLRSCLDAQMVVFSGLKIDKLDDLEGIIGRGRVRHVLAAGSLAMALKKATHQLDGGDFCIGLAEAMDQQGQPFFIPSERIEQARRMIDSGRRGDVQFILPVDFVLQDGEVHETIGPGDQQFDVGPATSELFERHVTEFINRHRGESGVSSQGVVFHNGVFGKFEDPRFESGTKRFIGQLKRMTDAGIEVYVGGGEGGAALERYGNDDWVTHCFTAGGTVLNALSGEPIPYLKALRMASLQSREPSS